MDVDAFILPIVFLSHVVNWMYVCVLNIFRQRNLQFFVELQFKKLKYVRRNHTISNIGQKINNIFDVNLI